MKINPEELICNPKLLEARLIEFAAALTDLLSERDALLKAKEDADSKIAELASENAAIRLELDAAQQNVDKLQSILLQFKRVMFGRRSEKLDRAQLQLELEDIEKAAAGTPEVQAPEAEGSEGAAPQQGPKDQEPKKEEQSQKDVVKKPRDKARRNQGYLPQHLPRVDIVIEPENKEDLLNSGAKLRLIGNDITEVMDTVPMKYQVLRYIRPRYAVEIGDGSERDGSVTQAPAPARAVEGGMVSEAMLIALAVNKFSWHLPLNRQAEMMRSQGIEIDRSTLSRWIDKTVWWLEPLYGSLKAYILAQPRLFCDETHLRVMAPGKTRKGQLWATAVDDRPWRGPAFPAVAYTFTRDRKGERADEILDGFTGMLQVDGYAGYEHLAKGLGPPVTLVFCNAHARRKLFDCYKSTKSPIAGEALRRIMEFYAVEERIRGMSAEARRAVRQAETRPLMEAYKTWLEERLAEISGASKLADAIRYTLKRWTGLTLFLDDGRLEIDNNTVERTMRSIGVGRHNALFAGSEGGAKNWAILASLTSTARLNGVDAQTWLTDALQRLVSGSTKINQIHELLPWNWKAAREKEAKARMNAEMNEVNLTTAVAA
jgi:transposase